MYWEGFEVVPPRIELGTQGFSVLCSTNWAMAPFPFWDCKGRNKILLCKFLDAYFLKKWFSSLCFEDMQSIYIFAWESVMADYTAATRIWGSNGVQWPDNNVTDRVRQKLRGPEDRQEDCRFVPWCQPCLWKSLVPRLLWSVSPANNGGRRAAFAFRQGLDGDLWW